MNASGKHVSTPRDQFASSFSEPRVDLRGSAFVKLKTPQSATLRCVVQVSRERITGAD
jgi:hypothetical protein